MSKRIARRKRREAEKRTRQSKRRLVIVVCALLMLSLSLGLMAQWKMLPGMSKPPVQPQPGSFNANSPSKEYIYAGGRLIATEEPAAPTAALIAPANLTAKASSTTQINLSWEAPAGATGYSYQIERSINYAAQNAPAALDHGFAIIATAVTGTSYTDTVSSNPVQTYLYRVRNVAGNQSSTATAISFATTKSFAEIINNQGANRTPIRATHFLELQEAVNSVRAAAGLQPFTWTDPQAPASGVPIRKTHMTDLRTALNQALSALGITPPAYTNDPLALGTPVQKVHIDELRQATRGVGQN
jgi:hypothetical protein